MSGKMFGGGEKAIIACTANISAYERGNLRGILTKGTSIDDRIGRIGVYVGDWHQVPLHADGAGFLGDDSPKLLGKLWLGCGSEGHTVGENGGAVQAHGEGAFVAGRHRHRDVGSAGKQ